MIDYEEKLRKSYEYIRSVTDFRPEVALVLGSGLGMFGEQIEMVQEISYRDIPDFPVSTVPGHVGRYIFGYVKDVPVVVMQGRVHYYEGYNIKDVVMPVRLMGMMGAKKLILTNAAGGINTDFSAGALMMLTDHISTFIPSPLIGKNMDSLGTRFPDMTEVYDKDLRATLQQTAENCGIELKSGVYLQVSGPQFETPQEIRMFGLLGADAVGMSTVCEAIAARHMGLRVCAVSCITNMAAGLSTELLSHEDVQQTADKVGADFCRLIREFIGELKNA